MFVRVVDPIDPWLDESRRSEQEEQFIGKYADISVAMTSRCCESIVLASLHGARDDVGYLDPGVFRFLDSEVELAGGLLNDTDANPHWPPEYNHAHNDIVREHHSVARAMINYYEHESGRLVRYQEVDVFVEVFRRPEVNEVNRRVDAADTVDTPEALDDADGIPVDVVIDEVVAVLKILTLADAIRGN